MADFKNFTTNFNDPSTSFANQKKGLTLRLWSITYMKKASEEIVFKAFLTDFSDEYTSNWTEDVVYGRMDPLSVFQNTQRVANVALDIPASSEAEAKSNLIKVQNLVKGVYPVYESITGVPVLQGAPLWKVKLSNLLTSSPSVNSTAKSGGLTCRLGGVTFLPDFEPGMFIDNGKMYPKNIKLSLSFYIFHDHTVGFDSNKRFQSKNSLNFPYAAGALNTYDESKVDGSATIVVDGAPMSGDPNDPNFSTSGFSSADPNAGLTPDGEQEQPSPTSKPASLEPEDGTNPQNGKSKGIKNKVSKNKVKSMTSGG